MQPHAHSGSKSWHCCDVLLRCAKTNNLFHVLPHFAAAPALCLQERLLEEIQASITESHTSVQRAANILLQQLVPGSLGRSSRRSGQSAQVLSIPNLDDRGVWLQRALDALLVKQHSRRHYEECRQQQQLQLTPPPGERRSADQCQPFLLQVTNTVSICPCMRQCA
jgi:hypothetical protein